jgi:hypothetical protein
VAIETKGGFVKGIVKISLCNSFLMGVQHPSLQQQDHSMRTREQILYLRIEEVSNTLMELSR